jgi:hypothetical protein
MKTFFMKTLLLKLTLVPVFLITLLGGCEDDSCSICNVEPTISDQSFFINENSPNGTKVGNVVSSDFNEEQILTYSIISGNLNEAFALDSSSGEITINDSTQIDFEENEKFELVIRVRDNGEISLSSTAIFSIEVHDVNEIPTDNLIAFYQFNGNVNDESENKYHGFVYDATLTTDRYNQQNSAYFFDGIDDYISFPTDFDYSDRTICFWFNAVNIPDWNYDINPNGSFRSVYTCDHPNLMYGKTNMWVTKDNGVSKFCFYHGVKDDILDNSFAIDEMRWYNVAITISSTTINYFVNGELFKTIDFPGNIHASDGENYAMLGVSRSLDVRFFNGKIDDVMIYKSALTAKEILQIYKEKI